MAEHHLHRSAVGAALEEVGREGVPQHVRTQAALEAGTPAVLLEILPESLARHRRAAAVHEQGGRRPAAHQARPRAVQPVAQALDRHPAQRHETLLAPLPEAAQHAAVEIDVARADRHQLGDPEPGGIQHLEHRGVAPPERAGPVGGRQQAIDLVERQEARQRLQRARRAHVRGRVAGHHLLGEQVPVEHPHRVERPRHRPRRESLAGQLADEFLDLAASHLLRRATLASQVALELLEVLAVGEDRVARQAALHRQVQQEFVDRTADDHRGCRSTMRVTGPSLTRSTSMKARKRPVSIDRGERRRRSMKPS